MEKFSRWYLSPISWHELLLVCDAADVIAFGIVCCVCHSLVFFFRLVCSLLSPRSPVLICTSVSPSPLRSFCTMTHPSSSSSTGGRRRSVLECLLYLMCCVESNQFLEGRKIFSPFLFLLFLLIVAFCFPCPFVVWVGCAMFELSTTPL